MAASSARQSRLVMTLNSQSSSSSSSARGKEIRYFPHSLSNSKTSSLRTRVMIPRRRKATLRSNLRVPSPPNSHLFVTCTKRWNRAVSHCPRGASKSKAQQTCALRRARNSPRLQTPYLSRNPPLCDTARKTLRTSKAVSPSPSSSSPTTWSITSMERPRIRYLAVRRK